MFNEIISNGSPIGVLLLSIGFVLFLTRAKKDFYKKRGREKWGVEHARETEWAAIGLISVIWLLIYIFILEGILITIGSFLFLLFILTPILSSKFFFRLTEFLIKLYYIIIYPGLYLTIKSLM